MDGCGGEGMISVIFCDVAMASGLGEPEKTLLARFSDLPLSSASRDSIIAILCKSSVLFPSGVIFEVVDGEDAELSAIVAEYGS